MSSGDSLARGATHCTSRNSETPSSSPVATSDSAKCSAESRMMMAAKTNIAMTQVRRGFVSCSPTHCETPSRSGSVAGILASRHA